MAPPLFKDLAKAAKDLLTKEFPSDHKVEIKSTTADGVAFTSSGTRASKDGKVSGNVSGKFKHSSGLTSEGKVDTKGTVTGDFNYEGLADGLKLKLKAATDKPTGSIGVEYFHDNFSTNVDFDAYSLVASGSAVFAYEGFLAGADGEFDTNRSTATRYSAAVGYKAADFAFTGAYAQKLSDGSYKGECTASYVHNVNKESAVAAEFVHSLADNSNKFTIGASYSESKDSVYKTKLNNAGVASFSWKTKVQPTVAMTVAAEVNTTKLDKDSHKVGLSFVISP